MNEVSRRAFLGRAGLAAGGSPPGQPPSASWGLYRRPWEKIPPTIPSFDQEALGSWIRGVEPEYLTHGGANSPGGFKAFEHRWAVTQAFEFMMAIGQERIASYTLDQASQLMSGLDAIDGIHVVTPQVPELHAGLVCIQVAGGRAPFALAERLLERYSIVSGVSPYRLPYLRLGPSIVTDPDQVDRAISAIAEFL
ncbi:MAG: hypothetical protein WKF47_14805 [Geodermatophilaceae bacterium]